MLLTKVRRIFCFKYFPSTEMTYEAHTLIAPMAYTCCWQASVSRVRWGRTVGRSVGDRPQVGGMCSVEVERFMGGLLMARPIAANDHANT